MMNSWAWIWLSGLAFSLAHSFLASRACKSWFYGRGLVEPYYRLFYSIFAVITTAVWVWFIHRQPDMPLYQTDGVVEVLLLGLQLLGLLMVLAAFQPIDGLAFLGLRKAGEGMEDFVVKGVYRYVRHPMYTGVMLILLAMPEQTYNGLCFSLAVCAYFVIGSRFEEKRMLKADPGYAQYQASVPAFIPRVVKR